MRHYLSVCYAVCNCPFKKHHSEAAMHIYAWKLSWFRMRSALGVGGNLTWRVMFVWGRTFGRRDLKIRLFVHKIHTDQFFTLFLPGSQANTGILVHWSWWCIELHSDSQNYHRGWYGGEPWEEKTHRTSHCRMKRKKKKTRRLDVT